MKVSFKKIIILAAFVGAGALAFDVYSNCKTNCLKSVLCRVLKVESKNNLCCQSKDHPQNTIPGKCGGKTCCFKKVQKTATIKNESENIKSDLSPIVFTKPYLSNSKFSNQPAAVSTGPPFYSNYTKQSILCVFII